MFKIIFYIWSATVCLLWYPLLHIAKVPQAWHGAFQTFWSNSVCFWLRVVQGLKMVVRGQDYISQTPVIYAVKHQSMLDTFIMNSIVGDTAFIMKEELLKIPLYGRICKKVGHIPIDRDMGMASMRKMLAQTRRAIDENRSVTIFPEGSRTDPGQALPYMSGIFGIYKYLRIPVVPVALNTGYFWPKKGPLKKGTFVVELLPPIEPGLQKEDFMSRLEGAIETACKALPETS